MSDEAQYQADLAVAQGIAAQWMDGQRNGTHVLMAAVLVTVNGIIAKSRNLEEALQGVAAWHGSVEASVRLNFEKTG